MDLAYLGAALATSILGFVVWACALTATISLLVFVLGAGVWFASTYLFRWTTAIDRRLGGWAHGEQIEAAYRRPRSKGVLERLRCVTTDPQTWRDLGWLVLNSVAGFGAALIGLSATALVLAYTLMPLWWWTIADPAAQYGTLNLGVYTVDDFGHAFVTSVVGLALMPAALRLNRALVAGHSGLAKRFLRPASKPLHGGWSS